MKSTRSLPAARVRVSEWPRRRDIALLALVDHHMVPEPSDVNGWLDDAAARGARIARTNALFPPAAEAFSAAGFETVDALTLLEFDFETTPLPSVAEESAYRIRRLRSSDLPAAAELDRRAFGDEWSNDAASLDAIRAATPYHRSRLIDRFSGPRGARSGPVAFALSGRAGRTGYVQRVAVDGVARRRGLGRALVVDGLHWMSRRSARRALVNTAEDNVAALHLYLSLGFRDVGTPLRIMERRLDG